MIFRIDFPRFSCARDRHWRYGKDIWQKTKKKQKKIKETQKIVVLSRARVYGVIGNKPWSLWEYVISIRSWDNFSSSEQNFARALVSSSRKGKYLSLTTEKT